MRCPVLGHSWRCPPLACPEQRGPRRAGSRCVQFRRHSDAFADDGGSGLVRVTPRTGWDPGTSYLQSSHRSAPCGRDARAGSRADRLGTVGCSTRHGTLVPGVGVGRVRAAFCEARPIFTRVAVEAARGRYQNSLVRRLLEYLDRASLKSLAGRAVPFSTNDDYEMSLRGRLLTVIKSAPGGGP